MALAITSNRAQADHFTGEVSLGFGRKLSKVLAITDSGLIDCR
jgi:hypothetical protein